MDRRQWIDIVWQVIGAAIFLVGAMIALNVEYPPQYEWVDDIVTAFVAMIVGGFVGLGAQMHAGLGSDE